jgi:hypothetical protein
VTEILSPSDNAGSNTIPSCPYKGLVAYTEADADYFFGRDSDRELVIANLMASRLTVLYGPSGVGKSSLLQAGVMPHLRLMPQSAFSYLAVRNSIIVYHSSWHSDSLIELGSALLQAIPAHDDIGDILKESRPLSVDLLDGLTERLNSYVYLLLDQFEEQTLYQPGLEGESFLAELGRIITSPGLRASVLLAIQEDALAKLDRLEAYVPGLYGNNLRLRDLNRAAAREAIEAPLTRYNAVAPARQHVTIDPQLIEDVLQQLQTVPVDDARQGYTESHIETPFLQLVMTRLWYEEAERGSLVLRRLTLKDLGGVSEIARTHLDVVMSKLTEQQKGIAAKIFRYLVTPSGTKISHTTEDLAFFAGLDPAQVGEVLDRLSASRERVVRSVLHLLGSDEAPRYEIFHDVMAPAVLDWLRRYVTERERIAREQELMEKHQAEEEFRRMRKRLRLYALLSAPVALLLVTATVIITLGVTKL